MTVKRQKVTKDVHCKCHGSTRKSHYSWNIIFFTLRVAAANRPGETLTLAILYPEPNDYKINFVNVDSCHQYEILGAILQMSFL